MLSDIIFENQGGRIYGGYVSQAGAVGDWGVARLANPDNSGVNLILLNLVTYSNSFNYNFGIISDVTDLESSASVFNLMTGADDGQGVFTYASDVAQPATDVFNQVTVSTSESQSHNDSVVIVPGYSLEVYPNSANAQLEVSYVWAEVPR